MARATLARVRVPAGSGSRAPRFRSAPPRMTRRQAIGAAMVLPALPALAGCRDREESAPPPPLPGAALLDAAVADEERLLASYDAAFAASPALAAAFGHIRRH